MIEGWVAGIATNPGATGILGLERKFVAGGGGAEPAFWVVMAGGGGPSVFWAVVVAVGFVSVSVLEAVVLVASPTISD